jgi:outer membrane lipoprotein-sorting protein
LVLGFLSGCALFGPSDSTSLKQATAEQLTALLQEQAEEVRTIKGLFSAKITGGILPIGQRVQGTVFYQRPDSIRLRGFTAVGSELFEFVQIEDQFKLRLPTMGREVAGRPSEPDRLGQLTRPFQLSVWAMSGIIGTQAVRPAEQVRLIEDGNRYRLDVLAEAKANGAGPTVTRRIWFDRHNLLVVKEERVSPDGDVEATMQFDDYRVVGVPETGGSINIQDPPVAKRILRPFTIHMTDGQGSGSVHVTFHELVPNEPIKPSELGRV